MHSGMLCIGQKGDKHFFILKPSPGQRILEIIPRCFKVKEICFSSNSTICVFMKDKCLFFSLNGTLMNQSNQVSEVLKAAELKDDVDITGGGK